MLALPYVLPLLFLFLGRTVGDADPWLGGLSLLAGGGVQLVLLGLARRLHMRRAERLAEPADPAERVRALSALQRTVGVLQALFLAVYFAQLQFGGLTGLTAELRMSAAHLLVPAPTALLPSMLPTWWVAVPLQPVGLCAVAAVLRDVAADLLLLVPPYAALLGLRAALFGPTQRLRQLDSGLAAFVGFHARLAAISVLPVFLYVSIFQHLPTVAPHAAAVLAAHPALSMLLALGLITAIFALGPLFSRSLFPRVAPQAFVAAERWVRLEAALQRLAARAGTRLRRLHVWRSGGLRIANAAVAGLLTRHQHFFVTDALLNELPDDEVVAVMAHEIAHQRLRHPLQNLVLAVLALGFVALGMGLLVTLWSGFKPEVGLAPTTVALAVVGLNLLYLMTVLRYRLNRFELQADALAAHYLGDSEVLMAALARLGLLQVVDVRRASITHPSMLQRLQALDAWRDAAACERWLRREIRGNRRWLLLALGCIAATAASLEWLATT